MAAYAGGPITTESIQKYLDENKQLILAILDNQNLGKLNECASYQAKLQQNLMYLAAIADAQPQAPQTAGQGPAGSAVQQGQYLQHQQQQQQMAHPAMLQQGQRNQAQQYMQQQSHQAHQQQQAMHGGQQGMVSGGGSGISGIHHMMPTDQSGAMGGNGTTSSSGFPDYGHAVKAGPGGRDGMQSGMGMQHVEMRSGGGPNSDHMGVSSSMGQAHNSRDGAHDSEPSYLKASDEDGST